MPSLLVSVYQNAPYGPPTGQPDYRGSSKLHSELATSTFSTYNLLLSEFKKWMRKYCIIPPIFSIFMQITSTLKYIHNQPLVLQAFWQFGTFIWYSYFYQIMIMSHSRGPFFKNIHDVYRACKGMRITKAISKGVQKLES